VLIGESLMRAKDTSAFIRELLSIPPSPPSPPAWSSRPPLVKICGIRTKDEALAAANAGADLLGLVFAEKSKRFIDLRAAKQISYAIRSLRYGTAEYQEPPVAITNGHWFTTHASRLSLAPPSSRPLLVGVFQSASLADILRVVEEVQLDAVQLHGAEPFDWARHIPVPVIRAFHVGKSGKGIEDITRGGAHQFVLLDSVREDGSGMSGGSGKVVDLALARRVVEQGELDLDGKSRLNVTGPQSTNSVSTEDATKQPVHETAHPLPIILAGGLTPENVAAAIAQVRPWAVDVSGGVENDSGNGKDLQKLQAFINAAKGILTPEGEAETSEIGEQVLVA
jgi:anthranilate synthase/indole-3-glycerol phosphate synthase/phosphoribosylanthranilate isomerase